MTASPAPAQNHLVYFWGNFGEQFHKGSLDEPFGVLNGRSISSGYLFSREVH